MIAGAAFVLIPVPVVSAVIVEKFRGSNRDFKI